MKYSSKDWKCSKAVVDKALKIVNKQIIAMADLKLYIPNRYVERKFCILEDRVQTLAIFAVVVDGQWAMFCLPNMMTLEVNSIAMVEVDGEEFIQLSYEKGDLICENTLVFCDSTICYRIIDLYHLSGYHPWFVGYENYGKILELTRQYASLRLSDNNVASELIVAQSSRSKKDHSVTFRNSLKGMPYNPVMDNDLYVAPTENILLGTTNFMTQVNGAYLNHGLLTALTKPTEKGEKLEEVLRM